MLTCPLSLLLASTLVLSADASHAKNGIGKHIQDFTLRDGHGRKHALHEWADRKLVVVVFLGVECPLSKVYAPRLKALARKYDSQGVQFVGIGANRHDTRADLVRFEREHGITFPLLKDTGNVVADRFGAARNPEAFVLDEKRVIRYRGRIDDRTEVGLQKQKANREYLAQALEELLAGKAVSEPMTRAPG